MDEHVPDVGTSPRRMVEHFLDEMRLQVPYAGALVTVYDPLKGRQVAVVNRGYTAELVSYVLHDDAMHDANFQFVASHPDVVVHWDTLPGIRRSEIVTDFLIPSGFSQGASMALDGGPGGVFGSFHVSLDESLVTPANLGALAMARRALIPLVAAHRMRLTMALSARELDVLELMCTGLSNTEIAAELWVSRRTIATHVEHILRKLGAGNRVQASVRAVRLGLVGPAELPVLERAEPEAG